jgi:hypothetical protein
VLDAVESFLFDGHGEVAIEKKRRGRIAVVRIQA